MKILLGAYILDLLLGDPQGFPHPVRFIGNYINFLEGKLLNLQESREGQFLKGMLLTMTVVITTYIFTYYTIDVAYRLHPYAGTIVSIILGYTLLATRSLDIEARKVHERLEISTLKEARIALSYIVGRDTKDLQEKEIIRATIETIGENISDGIIAPMFYLFIGGVPLAMAYKAVNTLDSMVGYKNDRYLYFGRFSAKLDDVVNFIPARLTAIFMILAAFFNGKDWRQTIKTIIRDRKNHTSPNAGYPEAAIAGALRIQLGGVNKYFGKEVYKPTIGNAIVALDRKHIIDAIHLIYWTSAIAVTFFSILKIMLGDV